MDLIHDPQEDDPQLRRIIRAAEREAVAAMHSAGIAGFGACHAIWAEQKRILRERHGIIWRTPAEMNSHVNFD